VSIPFVPVVVPPPTPSRQAQELADLVNRVVSEYEQTHSSITPAEVQQALMMAQQRSQGAVGARRLVAVALGGAFALGAGILAFARGSGVPFDVILPWLELGVVGVLVIAVVVVLLRRRP
jgi:hypothetical protein